MFVTVRAYKNGYHLPASELTLNVNQIVSFWDGTVRLNGVDETPVVYLDTVRTSGLVIAGTAAELRSHIQCGELAVFSGIPFQPKQRGDCTQPEECEFCGGYATNVESFDRDVHVCDQCSADSSR